MVEIVGILFIGLLKNHHPLLSQELMCKIEDIRAPSPSSPQGGGWGVGAINHG